MQRSGAILALIGGILTALISLFAVMSPGVTADTGLRGWGGLIFASVVIVLGAVGFNTTRRAVGVLVMCCTAVGALIGPGTITIFMLLALIGGALITFGR